VSHHRTLSAPALPAAMLALLALSFCLPWLLQARSAGAQAQQAAEYRIFLPSLHGDGATPPPPPPPPPSRGGLYPAPTKRTGSAATATDARGGMHLAYTDAVSYAEQPLAHYRFCPPPASACADPAAWAGVELGALVDEVQLALTPAGQPRLLIQSWRSDDGAKLYSYAACDSACTSQASWTVTEITYTLYTAIADVHETIMPQRFFALDRQGRPAFVYYDRNYYIEPDHLGVFYATCESGCDDAGQWTITPIGPAERAADEQLEYPSLTFTSTGQPRVIATAFGTDETGIYYIGCDSACTEGESWERVRLTDRGSGYEVGWDIALDAQDRPRIAFFPGTLSDGSGQQLYYAWCDSAALAGCLDSSQWGGYSLGLPKGSGQQPDLLIDRQGRPRVAFISGGEPGYTWCDSGCEGAEPQWQYDIVESAEAMKQANPQAIPVTCNADLWTALAPVLALDPDGNPRIGFDVAVEARCLYQGPNDPEPYSRLERIWHGARLVYFAQQ
jgi:hypothetical protein